MVEVNPHYISQLSTGATIGQIEDDVDFPHTGLFKSLMQGVSGNFVVKNNTNDFDITQSASDPVVSVAVGSYLDNGELKTTSGVATFNAAAFTFTTNKAYYLLVVNSSGTVALRVPTVANRVANHSAGDTIIAMIEIADDTAFGARKVQFFTSSKTKNSLSIGRDNSGAYTESASIKSNSGDIEIEALEKDKDIIFKVNDGGSSTEAMRIDGATANVGIGTNAPTEKLHLSDADGTEPTILIENTGTDANEPELVFLRSTSTGADSRDIGNIKFKAKDTAGNLHTFAQIMADSLDADTTTEDGRLVFSLTKAGTDHVEFFAMGNLESVFNNGGNDINLRAEGSSDANLLFVDAGQNRVGIKTGTPSVELDVAGAITSSGTITGVIGALTTVNATDVNTGNITSTLNQNISYEVVAHPATPVITGTKTVAYIHDMAALGNTVALPVPASGNILYIKNIFTNPITITSTPPAVINMGDTTHPKITSANVITLAPFEHITLQAVNDATAPLVTGHMIISD